MFSVETFITAARQNLGTPFHHQGRTPRVGLDCIGLVIVAAQECGFVIDEFPNYAMRPRDNSLIEGLIDYGAVQVFDIVAGDLLLFRYDGQVQHIAIATSSDSMIHSFAPAGCVVETLMGDYWLRRLACIYRIPKLLEV